MKDMKLEYSSNIDKKDPIFALNEPFEKSLSTGTDDTANSIKESDRYAQILKLAVPAILNNFIRQLFQLINLHFVA